MRRKGYYRRGGYRRRRWKNIVIIAISAIVIAFVLFLVLGNILKDKTELPDDDSESPEHSSSHVDELPSSRSINAYNVDISGITLTQFSERLSDLSKTYGTTAVSLNLTDSNGDPLYDSKISKELGYQENDGGLISLSSLVTRAKSRDVYVSAHLTLRAFEEEDAGIRSIRLAYEAALVAEILQTGIDDIVIICPDMYSGYVKELLRFSENIKSMSAETKVGICFTKDFLSERSNTVLIDDLIKAYDFTAIDLTKTEKGSSEADSIDSALSDANVRYYVLRYNTRVLISSFDDEETYNGVMKVISDNSINNWQMIS